MKDCIILKYIYSSFQCSHKGNWEAQGTHLADSPRYMYYMYIQSN